MQYIDIEVFNSLTNLKKQKALEADVDIHEVKFHLYIPIYIAFYNSISMDFFTCLTNLLKEQADFREFQFSFLVYVNIKNLNGVAKWCSQAEKLIESLKANQQYLDVREWCKNNISREVAEKRYRDYLREIDIKNLESQFMEDRACIAYKTQYHPFSEDELNDFIKNQTIDWISLQQPQRTIFNKKNIQYNCIFHEEPLSKTFINALDNAEKMKYERNSLIQLNYIVKQGRLGLTKRKSQLKTDLKEKTKSKIVNDQVADIFVKMAISQISPEFLARLMVSYFNADKKNLKSHQPNDQDDVKKLLAFLNNYATTHKNSGIVINKTTESTTLNNNDSNNNPKISNNQTVYINPEGKKSAAIVSCTLFNTELIPREKENDKQMSDGVKDSKLVVFINKK